MPRHCDDYINDPAAPDALRRFLLRAREPAHGALNKDPYPKLYATYKNDLVRVTMASRLGDVGIKRLYSTSIAHRFGDELVTTYANDNGIGYEERVYVEELTDFSETIEGTATSSTAIGRDALSTATSGHDVVTIGPVKKEKP